MKQIIPCNVEMYAIYDCGEEGKIKERVLAFVLDEEGFINPLVFDHEIGLIDAEAENFVRYEYKGNSQIADALESIASKLDALEDIFEIKERLDDCIGYIPSDTVFAGRNSRSWLSSYWWKCRKRVIKKPLTQLPKSGACIFYLIRGAV